MRIVYLLVILPAVLSLPALADTEKIKIGVPTTLTGESATFGTDVKNALLFANAYFFSSKYEFVIEDDKCDSKEAVTIAHKFATVDKLRYVLGIACNSSLLAAAPIYERHGITVITSSATSGDKTDIGRGIFRLFPADQSGAVVLYRHIAPKFRSLGVLTEQNEYPALMERFFLAENDKASVPRIIHLEQFATGTRDLRGILLNFKKKGVDAVFLNTQNENTYIEAVRSMKKIGLTVPFYSVYYGASETSMRALGKLQEGAEFANLPLPEYALDGEGRKIMEAFHREYGPSKSIAVIAPLSIDSLRMLDAALASGKAPAEYLRTVQFPGLLGSLSFDDHGAVERFAFQMQRIRANRVELIAE